MGTPEYNSMHCWYCWLESTDRKKHIAFLLYYLWFLTLLGLTKLMFIFD